MEAFPVAREENRRFNVWSMSPVRRALVALQVLFFGTGAEKRRVRQELARISAGIFGDFPIGDDHKLWREDKEFLSEFRRLSPFIPYSEERKYTLREFARYTRGLPGDMAECGCYIGVSAWFMAKESPETDFFLFDSFEGLSEPDANDQVRSNVRGWKAGDLATSEELLRSNLAEFERIHVLKGWIPERFNDVADRRFRLVHIDVDLFQPTVDSLAFFYPRMVDGGVIVMDDYGFLTCPGATRAAEEFMADKAERILHLPTGQGVIICRSGARASVA